MDNWISHIPVLTGVLKKFKCDRVLELGTGYGSTPLIIESSKFSKHFETNRDWYEKMKDFNKDDHEIIFFENYTLHNWDCDELNKSWDVVFVDNAPGESRISNLLKVKDNAQIIICHDTEYPGYGWDFSPFKYTYTHKIGAWTTVCSNHIDLSDFNII